MNSSPALDRVTGGRIIARKKRFGGVRFGLAKGFRHQFISKPLTFSPYNRTRRDIRRRMIVRQDYSRSIVAEGRSKQFGDPHLRRVDAAVVYLDHIQDVVASAQYHHQHVLLVTVPDHRADDIRGVFGAVDRPGDLRRGHQQTFPQGERRLDAGCRAVTDAVDIRDFGDVRPVQAVDIPEASEERLGDLDLLRSANDGGQQLDQIAAFGILDHPVDRSFPWGKIFQSRGDLQIR